MNRHLTPLPALPGSGALRRAGKPALIAFALVGLLAFAACGAEDSAPEAASSTSTSAGEDDAVKEQTFTQADSGKEAKLATGEEIVVSLETCGGCGYQWRVTKEADAGVIESLGSTNQARPTTTQPGDPPLVGVPTDENFRFRGVASGRTEVTIGYFPPADDAPEESFTLIFVVE